MGAYANYELVRDEVLRMRDGPGDDTLFDASPSIAESLRRHSFQVGGARPDDYQPGADEARRQLEARLRKLTELEGDALLVPEARALGGFGYEIDGDLYNADTLKFFETLVALERGAVLDELRAPERRLVWEIGAGWGGLAYQLKTLFPDLTYVIVDAPERFLFSATYLMTLFPDAKVHFHGDGEEQADWDGIDFAFVPARMTGPLRAARPDVVLKPEQFDGYPQLAWELGCPFSYTFGRDGQRAVLGDYYWLHELPLLELETPSLPQRLRAAIDPDPSYDYRHVIGWRRTTT